MVKVSGAVSRVEMNAKCGALDTAPDTRGAFLCKDA